MTAMANFTAPVSGSSGGRQTGGIFALIGSVLPLAVLVYSFLLLAPEARFTVMGITLPPYRLVLIPLFLRVMLSYVSGRIRPGAADLLVLIASISTLISFMHHYGAANGAVRGFGTIIDSAGAFYVARSCIRTPNDLRIFLIMIAPGMLFSGALMALESASHRLIVRPFFERYFGSVAFYTAGQEVGSVNLRYDYRIFGLLRAYGVFSHPILGGIILSSSLLLFYYSSIRGIPKFLGLVAAGCGFFALSSATIISLGISFVVIFSNIIVQKIRSLSWWLVTLALFLMGFFVEVASKGGLINVLIRQTLDPQTGYFRKLIWEYGLISVQKNPLFGIGYEEYERPPSMQSSSVDAHFLALGIRDGVVPPIAILAAMIFIQLALGRAIGRISGVDRKLLFGVNGAMVGLFIASMTVTFFSEGLIWFMAMLGIGASLGQLAPRGVQGPVSAPPGSDFRTAVAARGGA